MKNLFLLGVFQIMLPVGTAHGNTHGESMLLSSGRYAESAPEKDPCLPSLTIVGNYLTREAQVGLLVKLYHAEKVTEQEGLWALDFLQQALEESDRVASSHLFNKPNEKYDRNKHLADRRDVADAFEIYKRHKEARIPASLELVLNHLVLKRSSETVNKIDQVETREQLHKFMTEELRWTVKASRDKKVLSYSNAGYTLPIQVEDKIGPLSLKVREDIKKAINSGTRYIEPTALPHLVADSPHANTLNSLASSLGWKTSFDRDSGTVTYRVPGTRSTITTYEPGAGHKATAFSLEDKAGLIQAVEGRGSYSTLEAIQAREKIGKATLGQLLRVGQASHIGTVIEVLRSDNLWKTKSGPNETVILTNRRFRNTMTFPELPAGSRFPGLSAEERNKILEALQNNNDYTFPQ